MSLHPLYARPRNVPQAIDLLGSLGAGAVVIAGGQELMPHVNYGKLMPAVYVDIAALPELQGIALAEGVISIGALTAPRTLTRDPLVTRHLPLLAHAAGKVGGGWQVQSRGTVGGNIVSMHPLYDIVPALLALDAEVEVAGSHGARRTSLAALISETSHGLGSAALLVRVLVRVPPPTTGSAYEKLKNTEGSYGSANAAAVVTLDGPAVASGRLMIGAVSERAIDASSALAAVIGRPFDAAAADRLAAACSELVAQPLSDQQGDAAWRRAMAGVMAARAVASAVHRASGADAREGRHDG
jgi:carbon-monoxide dehydrogenase medium subunit